MIAGADISPRRYTSFVTHDAPAFIFMVLRAERLIFERCDAELDMADAIPHCH